MPGKRRRRRSGPTVLVNFRATVSEKESLAKKSDLLNESESELIRRALVMAGYIPNVELEEEPNDAP